MVALRPDIAAAPALMLSALILPLMASALRSSMAISAASFEIVVVPWRMLPPLALIVAADLPSILLSAISPAMSPSAAEPREPPAGKDREN